MKFAQKKLIHNIYLEILTGSKILNAPLLNTDSMKMQISLFDVKKFPIKEGAVNFKINEVLSAIHIKNFVLLREHRTFEFVQTIKNIAFFKVPKHK